MSHSHSHRGDEKRLRRALILTAGFALVEALGGIVSGSLALLADAGHMLTDAAALALAWAAARVADKPADALRSYGYHRLQILAAFTNGIAFLGVVLWICAEAVARVWDPVVVDAPLMLAVAGLGLAVNLVAFGLLHGAGSANLNIRGALVHVLGDLLGSVAAIAAALVIHFTGWLPIDPLLSVFVALLILRSAWIIVSQSAHILLEGTPPDVDTELLRSVLADEIPSVRNVHHVHVWSLTPERPLLTMHVDVLPDADFPQVLERVKAILAERFGITHSTVQLEQEVCAD